MTFNCTKVIVREVSSVPMKTRNFPVPNGNVPKQEANEEKQS